MANGRDDSHAQLRRLYRWLDAQLAGDDQSPPPDARARRLLAQARRPLEVLDCPPLSHVAFGEAFARAISDGGELAGGARVGPFRIERVLGAGGMGAVYLARRVDGGFEQQVALKVLIGACPDRDSLAQFERERAVLARLEHPNIARLIDGGTTADRRPWFAMEYVDGESIDRYADRHRLSVEQRLRLFMQVCRALEYAHGRLVLHRDIKPSNVMVTDSGRVKLLDFGLGRMRAGSDPGATAPTRSAMRWLTPEYASPEQMRGETVAVASEVYQLGALLYRLLCSQPPFDFHDCSPVTMTTSVCERMPLRPAACWRTNGGPERASRFGATPELLARRLGGDLDNIVVTALAKSPNDRYGSVTELVEDLVRHLEHRPVRARAATRGYRLRKFVRRYRLAVSATAAAFVLIASALVVITWQSRVVVAERDLARFEAARWEVMSDQLLTLFRQTALDAGDADLSARELLAGSVDRVDRMLADDPDGLARVQAMLGALHVTLQDYVSALPLLEAFIANDDGSAPPPLRSQVYQDLARVKLRMGDPSAALEAVDRARTIIEPLAGDHDRRLAGIWRVRGRVLAALGWWDDAVAAGERAVALASGAPDMPDRHVAVALSELASTLAAAGRMAESVERQEEAMAMWRELGLEESHEALELMGSLAVTALRHGRIDEARRLFERAIELRQRHYGPSASLAWLHREYARLLTLRYRLEPAHEHLDRALAMSRRFAGPQSPQYAETLQAMGRLALAEDHPELALDYLSWAESIFDATLGSDHVTTLAARGFRLAARLHVAPREAAGQLDDVAAGLREAGSGAALPMATLLCEQARFHLDAGRLEPARAAALHCSGMYEALLPATAWRRIEAEAVLAAVETRLEVDNARERLIATTDRLGEAYGAGHPRLEWLERQW